MNKLRTIDEMVSPPPYDPSGKLDRSEWLAYLTVLSCINIYKGFRADRDSPEGQLLDKLAQASSEYEYHYWGTAE